MEIRISAAVMTTKAASCQPTLGQAACTRSPSRVTTMPAADSGAAGSPPESMARSTSSASALSPAVRSAASVAGRSRPCPPAAVIGAILRVKSAAAVSMCRWA